MGGQPSSPSLTDLGNEDSFLFFLPPKAWLAFVPGGYLRLCDRQKKKKVTKLGNCGDVGMNWCSHKTEGEARSPISFIQTPKLLVWRPLRRYYYIFFPHRT